MTDTCNAQIERTMLGYEDHGIFTIYLTLKYANSGQAYGGYALDNRPIDGRGDRQPTVYAGKCIAGILKTLGVDSWEQVKGQYVRVRRDAPHDKVTHIGHLLKDQWFSFKEALQ